MKVIDSNQHHTSMRIRDSSPETLLVKVGNDLDVVIRNRADGSATVTMHHGKLTVEKTFYPISVLA